MARIREFYGEQRSSAPHPTEVDCDWQVVEASNVRLLQLSTYGSDHRQSKKKVSQTIQLDQQAATVLMQILKSTFPGAMPQG